MESYSRNQGLEATLLTVLFWIGVAAVSYGACWLAGRWQARRAELACPPIGQFVSVESVPLHYVRRGSGRPVVLLHGSDGFLQDYTLTVMDRIAAGADAIAFDRPGHGYSELPPGASATAPVQARLIHGALRKLGVERPILVGHSWSGLLLLYYAWKYPDDVSGLVLLAPWIYPGRLGEPFLRFVSQPWISIVLYPLFVPIKRFVIHQYLVQGFHPASVPETYSLQAETLWLRTPRQLAATARENSGNRRALRGFSPDLVSSAIPVVVVVGDQDRVTPPDRQARRLKEELPQARLTVLLGTGHELAHSVPDAVIDAIADCAALAESADRREAPAEGPASALAPRTYQTDRSNPTDQSDYERARELVMRFGWNSAAYQILNTDIEHWFTSDGEACIGFVRWGGVRVAAGAPVCAEDRLAEVAAEFEREARLTGERVCYFGAAERLRSALLALPAHSALPVGAQPGWRPEHWEEILKRHRSLRAQLNRARNKAIVVTEWEAARAASDADLQRCFEEWTATHAGFSLHFLTEPVALNSLADRRVFVAERDGVPAGFLVAAPIPERRGWLVEQIVRGSTAPNGTAELLIDGLMRAVAAERSDFVTLGLAPLSRRGGVAPARRLWLRLLLAWVRAHGTRFYNFEGLDAFKGKFQPDFWEPIYAISNEPRFSVRTLYGIAAAFTEGAPLTAITRALFAAVRQEWRWIRYPVRIEKGTAEAGPEARP